jgi:hypothetical protein
MPIQISKGPSPDDIHGSQGSSGKLCGHGGVKPLGQSVSSFQKASTSWDSVHPV